jgi:hypothetical protein
MMQRSMVQPSDSKEGDLLVLGFGPVVLKPLPPFLPMTAEAKKEAVRVLECRAVMPFNLKGLLFECAALSDIWVQNLLFSKNSVLLSESPVPATSLLEIAERLRYEPLRVNDLIELSVMNVGHKELVFGGLFYGTAPQ